jgi:hypothetical protein
MSRIPNEPVVRKIENAMQGNGEFNDPKIGGKVNRSMVVEFPEFVSNFGSETREVVQGEPFQLARRF